MDTEVTYRVYFNDTECEIFNSLKKAKKFVKDSCLEKYELIKYVFHHRYIPWQDSITLIKKD
jgi:hypothetical protein